MLAAAGQAVFLIEQNAHSALAISAHAYAMALGEVRQLPQGTVSMDDEELRSLYL
jgi:ABC-type branched-subunit amino acid transport system ATPase component